MVNLLLKIKLSKKDTFVSRNFNIILKDLTKKERKAYSLKGGAKIVRNANKSLDYYGVKEGYIITEINKKPVSNASEAAKILDNSNTNGSPIYIEVINLEGERERYAFR